MKPLTILHLSDLHWSPGNSQDLEIVVRALLEDLDRLRKSEDVHPDLIVFSGDLAMGGDTPEWFHGAYEALILPVAKHAGLGLDRVFVCPGNHDMAREQVRKIPSIDKALRERLITAGSINAFMDKEPVEGSEEDMALRRVQNFYAAHDHYHPPAVSSSNFLRTYVVDVAGRSIGVACFNSAWRATGEAEDVDYKRLIIGERAVDRALDDLNQCDVKIAVHHHPSDWMVSADSQAVDFLLRKSFNLTCCGHVHGARPYMSMDAVGACVLSQAGSVFAGREWFNGYQIVQIDIPSQAYTFIVREYINQHRRYDAAIRVCEGGRTSFVCEAGGDPKRTDRVEWFLRDYRDLLRREVAQQLDLMGTGEAEADRPISELVTPPIFKRTRGGLEAVDGVNERPKRYSVSELLNEPGNLLVLGDRQSGKSAIAYYAAYCLAFEPQTTYSIPVYVDLRDYKFNRYALRRAITNFYGPGPSGFNIDRAIDDGLFVFLADNLATDESVIGKFAGHSKEFEKNRWIVFGTPQADGVSPDRLFNENLAEFSKYHIGELTRGGIRAFSRRWWKNDVAEAKAAYDMVISQLVRDGLPRTPYMVSLLLWGVQQKRDMTKINEAVLLSNIVDHLLGKADFRQSKRGVLNPVGKEIALQNLAKYLHGKGGVASENDVTSFLIEFFAKKKLAFIGGDVLDKLVSCGILRRDGDVVSFKFGCFQEFFLASLLKNDRKLLDHYLSELRFLDVRREMELLAGIRQQNDDIIEAISDVLDQRAPDRFTSCLISQFDDIAQAELKIGTTKAQLGEIRRTRLTDDQVDEIMDEADRRAMGRGERKVSESLDRADGNVANAAKEREAEGIEVDQSLSDGPIRPSTHMAAIDTLARVLRNSDFTDYDVKGPAAKRVVESWTKIFLLVMEEMHEVLKAVGERKGDPLSDSELSTIRYIMSKFMFGLIGSAVVNHMSSPSMADTLHSLIDEGDLSSGEYLLVLFLLEDVDDNGWQEKWSEVIADKKRGGFVIDCFVQRLLMMAQTKALDDNQAKRVSQVVSDIEKRLDWSNSQKSNVFEGIREAAAMTAIRENVT